MSLRGAETELCAMSDSVPQPTDKPEEGDEHPLLHYSTSRQLDTHNDAYIRIMLCHNFHR